MITGCSLGWVYGSFNGCRLLGLLLGSEKGRCTGCTDGQKLMIDGCNDGDQLGNIEGRVGERLDTIVGFIDGATVKGPVGELLGIAVGVMVNGTVLGEVVLVHGQNLFW